MRLTAFFKLYKICILLHRCNLKILAKNRFEKTAIFVKFQRKKLQMSQNLQNLSNKPLSGPRRRAPRPERGAWRWLCTAWVHSRKPCKRRTANRNEQKFTEQKRTCAIWNDSVGLIQHFSSRWPCRPLFRKCNNTSEHEFRRNGSCAAIRWKEKHHRVKLWMSTLGATL